MKKLWLAVLIIIVNLNLFAQNRSDSIHVAHYTLNMNVLDFANRQISASAELKIVALMDNLSEIRLDLEDFTIDSIKADGEVVSYQYLADILTIPVNQFRQGDTLEVVVYYHGAPSKDPYWGGFYFTNQCAYNMGVGMTVIPHSYGRCWYPCIDEFTDKSTYTYCIRTQPQHRAVCGGVLIDSLQLEDNTNVWTWHLSDPIPTYLSSIAVADFRCYRDTVQGIERVIPIEIYATPDKIDLVQGSFQHLKTIFHALETRFGRYPWQRIGYVVVPFMGGAMEHATNIAYPSYAVDGTLENQSLAYHEFAHAWFGNNITCSEAETMWLNEGFASYCELIADEVLDTTRTLFYQNLAALHHSVLKTTHVADEGFYALDAVPLSHTYGSTSYDKGALIAHTLRGYMGDTLFFNSLSQLFAQNSFANLSSEQFFQKLSVISGMDLMDFYLGWVHQPGFLHFSVDSVVAVEPTLYRVYLRQRLYNADYFANSNRIDLQFFAANGEQYRVENIECSGELDSVDLALPFAPVYVIVDPLSKLADAQIDYHKEMVAPSTWNCADAYCRVTLSECATPVQMYVECNLVAPDPLKVANDMIAKISPNHYWRIEFLPNVGVEGNLRFTYNAVNANALDYSLLNGYSKDHYVILYRRGPQQDWQLMPRTINGSTLSGTIVPAWFVPGEYVLAVTTTPVDITTYSNSCSISIHPNPTSNYLVCEINSEELNRHLRVEIVDSMGRLVYKGVLDETKQKIAVQHLPPATYYLLLKEGNVIKHAMPFVKK